LCTELSARVARAAGYESLRPGQQMVILDAVINRRDTYLQAPTSWGKSMLFAAAAFSSHRFEWNTDEKEMHCLLNEKKQLTLGILPTKVLFMNI
jgi:superfamily II DNA/RNA helicase